MYCICICIYNLYFKIYMVKDPSIQALNLKVPMKDKPNCDFSYAGTVYIFQLLINSLFIICEILYIFV